MPTPTPTPVPELAAPQTAFAGSLEDLISEYGTNKVLANSRYRYIENGRKPIHIWGYVGNVEKYYFELRTAPDSYTGANCYFADTQEALRLRRSHQVTVTGRVSGADGWGRFLDVQMFMCDVQGIETEVLPPLTTSETRSSVVRVYCNRTSWSGAEEVYQGTGVVVDAAGGLILTAHHIVEDDNNCETITVQLPTGGRQLRASVVNHCASVDQAYLRLSSRRSGLNSPTMHAASAPARNDQEVYFWGWGSPGLRFESGLVIDEPYSDTSRTTIDAEAVAGDSGSPVFNEFGHLLGIIARSNESDRAHFYHWNCEY